MKLRVCQDRLQPDIPTIAVSRKTVLTATQKWSGHLRRAARIVLAAQLSVMNSEAKKSGLTNNTATVAEPRPGRFPRAIWHQP